MKIVYYLVHCNAVYTDTPQLMLLAPAAWMTDDYTFATHMLRTYTSHITHHTRTVDTDTLTRGTSTRLVYTCFYTHVPGTRIQLHVWPPHQPPYSY